MVHRQAYYCKKKSQIRSRRMIRTKKVKKIKEIKVKKNNLLMKTMITRMWVQCMSK
jgi:hypothetical protein